MSKTFVQILIAQFNVNIPTFFLAIFLLVFLLTIKKQSSINKYKMVTIVLICVALTIFSTIDKSIGLYFDKLFDNALRCGYTTVLAYADYFGLKATKYQSWRYFCAATAYCLRIVLLMAAYSLIQSSDKPQKSWIQLPGIIAIALFASSPFTHLCFGYDNVNFNYYGGPLHSVIYFVAIFYMINVFFIIIKTYKNHNKIIFYLIVLFASAITIIMLESAGYIYTANDIVNPLFLITVSLYYMLIESHVVYEDIKKSEKDLMNSKIEAMNNQIRPHFIFNCISNIIELCEEDSLAGQALIKFSRYLRTNINSLGKSDPVPFENELDYIKNYISLEEMRYPGKFEMIYDIQTLDFVVPSISIEIYVENAIKHNVGEKDDIIHVELKTYKKNDYVMVEIKDDGVGFDVYSLNNMHYIGTNNAKYRLNNMINAQVDIHSIVGRGSIVSVKIPQLGVK